VVSRFVGAVTGAFWLDWDRFIAKLRTIDGFDTTNKLYPFYRMYASLLLPIAMDIKGKNSKKLEARKNHMGTQHWMPTAFYIIPATFA
jgi:hypothetical protein